MSDIVYENFISYKRSDSSSEAKIIYKELYKKGYLTFCDVEELGACKFNEELLNIIDRCTNFFLFVSKNTFRFINSTNYNDDWMYKEINQAISSKKNIVCIFLDGINSFPTNLPLEVKDISNYNGIEYSFTYLDAFIEKLEKRFLIDKERSSISNDLSDFIIDGTKLIKFVGYSKIVNIPDGIETVEPYAFKDNTTIEKINFPNSLIEIGEHSFERCLNLSYIKFGDNLKIINDFAFSRCFKVSSIFLNKRLEKIGAFAFAYCEKIKNIRINEGLISIDSSAFNDCSQLSWIDVDEKNEYFTSLDGILYSKNYEEIIRCPEGFKSSIVYINNSTRSIDKYCFYKCYNLLNIVIGPMVTNIKEFAFANCFNINTLSLPDNIVSFEISSLDGWKNNQKIIVSKKFNQALKYRIDTKLKEESFNNETREYPCKYMLVKTTFESYEEAESLSRHLLDLHLIVSGQITKIHSIYSWDEAIQSEDEYELSCFTETRLFNTISIEIKNNHSYELCELICVPILDISPEFGDWISNYLKK